MSSVLQQPASVDLLLGRLDGVQRSGKGFRAKCPACGGHSRKLSVSEADEGRILVHCFGGCDVLTVVQAIGLEMQDLFPKRLDPDNPADYQRRLRAAREAQWGAALDALALEATIIGLAGRQLSIWKPLSNEDDARLKVAVERVEEARAVLRPQAPWRPKQPMATS
jgi:hypothetical protein